MVSPRTAASAFATLALAAASAAAEPVVHHELSLRIDPATHRLEATDQLTLSRALAAADGMHLRLRKGLTVSASHAGDPAASTAAKPIVAEACTEHATAVDDPHGAACFRVPIPAVGDILMIGLTYAGEMHDPPRQDEGMRFVVGDKTSGTIGPEGVYLAGGYYPTPAAAPGTSVLHRFDVTLDVPEGWQGVGQGARTREETRAGRHVSRWENPITCDGLSVVAGPYRVDTREWNGITLATFLFEEDRKLAPAYLDAAQTFVQFYSELLRPYPYKQFTIVENFFATGYGMPAYTLLGREVVKMAERYTGAVGLGHEILHCWWGNYVLYGESEENWCEGLTTYCANYLYEEKTKGAEAAREYRRHTSERFSILVPVGKDYPVRRFVGKVTEIDNEVGYGKCSMIFHQVRQRLGDEKFFAALRLVIDRHGGRHALWSDFRKAFEETGGVDLGGFFTQWLERTGAPVLGRVELDDAELRAAGRDAAKPARVIVRVEQAPEEVSTRVPIEDGRQLEWTDAAFEPWQVLVPVRVHTGKRAIDRSIDLTAVKGEVAIDLEPGEEVERVEVDPDHHLFRRLRRDEIAPCLNLTLNAARRVAVLPEGGAAELRKAYEGIAARLRTEPGWTVLEPAQATDELLAGASLLLFGTPADNPVVARVVKDLPRALLPYDMEGAYKEGELFEVADAAVKVGLSTVQAPDGAVLYNVHNPWTRGQTISVFTAFDAAGAARPARLLFYYGWDGYVVWQKGQVAGRGDVVAPLGGLAVDFVKR